MKKILTFSIHPVSNNIVSIPLGMGEIQRFEELPAQGKGVRNFLVTVKGSKGKTAKIDMLKHAAQSHESYAHAIKRIKQLDPKSAYIGKTIKPENEDSPST